MAMQTSIRVILIFLLLLIPTKPSFSFQSCKENERQALLDFKHSAVDPSRRLSSWVGLDCCKWRGIGCDNKTGHVVKLDLRNPFPFDWGRSEEDGGLYGNHPDITYEEAVLKFVEVNPSLVELKHLSYLDLSWNNFSGIKIPNFFGSFQKLRYLNLSSAYFGGHVPHHLGNLSALESLDLSTGSYLYNSDYSVPYYYRPYLPSPIVDTLHWISNLISVQYLDMSGLNLSKVPVDSFKAITLIASNLLELHVRYCGINTSGFLSHRNLSSLIILDLSGNHFDSWNPNVLGNMTSLQVLDLSKNLFYGPVPKFLWALPSLKVLYLYANQLNGSIPVTFGEVSTLEWLVLSNNELTGSIPVSLCELPFLRLLDLSSNKLSGSIPVSLGEVSTLEELNLFGNDLAGSIPVSLGRFPRLRRLSLSHNKLNGSIPVSLGKLSSLEELSLYGTDLTGSIPVSLCRLPLLRRLHLSFNKLNGSIPVSLGEVSALEELNLSGNELTGSIPVSLGKLPLLRLLDLSSNKLNGSIPVSLGEVSTLEVLVLSDNELIGSIPVSLCTLPLLRKLELSSNKLNGGIPVSLGDLYALEFLFLSNNELTGAIPVSLGMLSVLKVIHLGNNRLTGTLPVSIGQLSELRVMEVSYNLLEGVLSEMHFVKLSKLVVLDLSYNSFKIEPSSGWVLPSNIEIVDLAYLHVGSQFPRWLGNLTNLWELNISNAGISDSIPDWFQHLTTQLEILDLSFNHVQGNISNLINSNKLWSLKLKSNQFEGQLPHFPPSLAYLDLSDNNFDGMMTPDALPDIQILDLSNNHIHGNIPNSLCEMENLYFLDLSKNHFSGTLPQCWSKLQKNLRVLDFSSNQLAGTLTGSVCKLPELRSLRLRENKFLGGISALKNCTSLSILDLGENALSGQIPTWIGERLSSLKILRLRSNKYNGGISPILCRLSKLQILDLAHNNLRGTIPYCFSQFRAMVFNQSEGFDLGVQGREKLIEVINGKEQEYLKILSLLINLDLSCNNLVGQIPQELTSLSGLLALNLSNNHLSGIIPENIGLMSSLVSLDFSRNNLSGAIPQTISLLFRLSALNLSNNNLSGAIPMGYQLQTLNDPSIYEGNNLCGAPLKKKCFEDEQPHSGNSSNEGEEKENKFWFYIGLASGIIVGFWGVWFVLFFKKTWRHAYFRLADDVKEKLLLFIEVRMKKLKSKLKNDEIA